MIILGADYTDYAD